MLLEPLYDMLVAANLGVKVFQDFMPGTVKNGVLILNPLGGNRINWELGSLFRKEDPFQVIVRSSSPQEGRPIANKIIDLFTITYEGTILPASVVSSIPGGNTPVNMTPPLRIQYMRPTQDPVTYPRQAGALWEISLNFKTTYVIQAV